MNLRLQTSSNFLQPRYSNRSSAINRKDKNCTGFQIVGFRDSSSTNILSNNDGITSNRKILKLSRTLEFCTILTYIPESIPTNYRRMFYMLNISNLKDPTMYFMTVQKSNALSQPRSNLVCRSSNKRYRGENSAKTKEDKEY